MNRLHIGIGILLAGAALFALASCGEETTGESLKIDISQKSVTIPAEGGSLSVSITAPVQWKVSTSDSWFSISPTEGEAGTVQVEFSAGRNESGESRTGTATVSAEGLQAVSVQVSQPALETPPPAVDTKLGLSVEGLSFEAAGGTLSFDLTANKDWTASVANAPWLTLDKTSGNGDATLSASAAENTSAEERSAVITFTSEEKSLRLQVSQKAAEQPDGVDIGGGVNDWGDGPDIDFDENK